MTRDEFTAVAIRTAAEISALALAVYDLDPAEVDADSTLLGAAIAKALIEAFEAGLEGDR
jgi:hypothetical protein